MKKYFATSLVAAALLGITGAGTAQAAEVPAGPTTEAVAHTAPAAGSALLQLPSLSSLPSVPTLILNEVVSAGRLIHDWM
jgi:hypothetical protein